MSTSTNRLNKLDESLSDEDDANENEFMNEAGEIASLTDAATTTNEVIIPTNELAAQTAQDLEDELSRFRTEWKRELNDQSADGRVNLPRFGVGSRFYERRESTQTSKRPVETGVLKPRAKPEADVAAAASTVTKQEIAYDQPQNDEEKARYLFSKGVMLEQQGRHYEAIQFYKMSMQLDPDIEFKVDGGQQQPQKPKSSQQPAAAPEPQSDDATEKKSAAVATKTKAMNEPKKTHISIKQPKQVPVDTKSTKEPSPAEQSENDVDEMDSLYKEFQSITLADSRFCQKNTPQSATHFSDLPAEVIMLIFKWVVSDHLDMRSLENLARVCKGFYVCARDQDIWKLACSRTWMDNSCLSTYNKNWREMYIRRPHLNFEGVYISKASYAREGEKSLDNFYRPWHLVEYYRYLRFFSNGTMLFLTTPEEPKQIVSKLKKPSGAISNVMPQSGNINTVDSILKGNWTLVENKVVITILRKVFKKPANFPRRQANKEPVLDQEHIFRIEMELGSTSERKLHNQLAWSFYEVCVLNRISNSKNSTTFDLNKIDFPNFYFSRVKSYTAQSDQPLR